MLSQYGRLTLFFLSILMLDFGVANGQQDRAKLRIGALLPLTGDLALFGRDLQQGLQMGLEAVGAENKELASRIELVIRDYGSVPERAVETAKELLNKRQADVILGPLTSSTTIMVYRAIESYQKPLISATATMPALTRIGDYFFRSCLDDAFQGRVLADFSLRTLKKARAAILIDADSTYAKDIAATFTQQLQEGNGTLLGTAEYRVGDVDYSKALAQLKRWQPQVVLLPAPYAVAARIIKEAKEQGLKTTFLGTDAWDSPKLYSSVEGAREALRGHFYTTFFSPLDPDATVRTFVQEFSSRYGHEPSLFAAMGYDASLMIANAFMRAKSNLASAMTKALASTSDVKSLMGLLSITRQRDVTKGVAILSTTPDVSKWRTRLNFAAIETVPGAL